MKTRKGRVLSPDQWERSLDRLVQKPDRMPIELYINFPQVPVASLDQEQLKVRPATKLVNAAAAAAVPWKIVLVVLCSCLSLPAGTGQTAGKWRLSTVSVRCGAQDSAERLAARNVHEKEEEAVKPMWMTYEVVMGKLVKKAIPWKKVTPEHSLQFCRSLYDRCAACQTQCTHWGCARTRARARDRPSTATAGAARTRRRSAGRC